MVRNKFILISALILSGCQSWCPAPGIKTVIQKVEVPISVPCKEVIPLEPAFNFDKLVPSTDIYGQSQAALADRLLHKGYEEELLAALTACVK